MKVDNVRLKGQPRIIQRLDIFDSLAEFAELAEMCRTDHQSSSWAGGTWEEALTLATEGWDAPLGEVETTITDTAETLQFAPVLDVAGDTVDLDLFLSGEPECMLSYPLQEREVSSISLMVPICYSAMVDEETVRKRGVAVAAAIEDMRYRGIMINVYGYMVITGPGKAGKKAVVLVKLADSRYAFDQGRVTYGAGHPTMLRQLMFGFEDGWVPVDHETFNIGGGRGSGPYGLGANDPEVRDYIYSLLDTEVSVDLPELDGFRHNGYSQQDHADEVARVLGGAAGEWDEDED